MATTPEGWVKKVVKELLEHWGVHYLMPMQNGMGKPSLDFLCCVRGKFLAIETKAPGKKLTLRQTQTIDAIRTTGGVAVVVNDWRSTDDLYRRLEELSHRLLPMTDEMERRWRRWLANAGCRDVDQPAA
jgi:hypothetical protein